MSSTSMADAEAEAQEGRVNGLGKVAASRGRAVTGTAEAHGMVVGNPAEVIGMAAAMGRLKVGIIEAGIAAALGRKRPRILSPSLRFA
jgi:hypothetical protein